MADTISIKNECDMSSAEVAELLSSLAMGIASGDLWLEDSRGGQKRLHSGTDMHIEVKASETRKRGELKVELSWQTNLEISSPAQPIAGE